MGRTYPRRGADPSDWTEAGQRLDRGWAAMFSLMRTNEEHRMPGNPRDMITNAERRFPVRIRVGVPPGGLGQRYAQITAWLDERHRHLPPLQWWESRPWEY